MLFIGVSVIFIVISLYAVFILAYLLVISVVIYQLSFNENKNCLTKKYFKMSTLTKIISSFLRPGCSSCSSFCRSYGKFLSLPRYVLCTYYFGFYAFSTSNSQYKQKRSISLILAVNLQRNNSRKQYILLYSLEYRRFK